MHENKNKTFTTTNRNLKKKQTKYSNLIEAQQCEIDYPLNILLQNDANIPFLFSFLHLYTNTSSRTLFMCPYVTLSFLVAAFECVGQVYTDYTYGFVATA